MSVRTALRPGVVSPTLPVPKSIARPEYVGRPTAREGTEPWVQPPEVIEKMRVAGRIAAGRLADRHVGPGQDVTTADMTVHFLAPILEGPARAEATVVRVGRRLSVIAVDVTDAARGRLAARATLSFAVLEPR